MPDTLNPEILQALADAFAPGARVVSARAFGDDEAAGGGISAKGLGYGQPILVELAQGEARRQVVVHTIRADSFGHDRRADRVSDVVLAFDELGAIPGHVRAVDAGLFGPGGVLSIATGGEPYLITEYVPGRPYADDLRRVARDGRATEQDHERCAALARYLANLHETRVDQPAGYRRALRDTMGHGEGIFGLVDAFPDATPAAPPERLQALEHRCLDLRWRLRDRGERLRRTHGDFHPFNLLFDGDQLHVLDASRGCRGDPADDFSCLAINYPFFALQNPATWRGALRALYQRFVSTYFEHRRDDQLFEAAPLYWTWRTLVLAHPRWYPQVTAEQRDALLRCAERALERGRFQPDQVEELFS